MMANTEPGRNWEVWLKGDPVRNEETIPVYFLGMINALTPERAREVAREGWPEYAGRLKIVEKS